MLVAVRSARGVDLIKEVDLGGGASKHGWRIFLYSGMRKLVCNGEF